MFDRDAQITFCNDYLLELTGWRLEEVIGRNVFEVFLRAERGDALVLRRCSPTRLPNGAKTVRYSRVPVSPGSSDGTISSCYPEPVM
jgi:PAS domain S-box-containing protein